MFEQVRATAISMKPTKWDKAANADRLEAFFREAARDEPDLMLAPEGVLEGYVVGDIYEGRRRPEEMYDVAEPIDGPYIARFQRLAKSLKTCLAFGFAELIGDEVYNAAIFVDEKGDIRGKYHKTQLAEGTHDSWFFNRLGESIRAFDTPFGRAGFLICNDRWNPLIARTLVLDGAGLLLIPSWGDKAKKQNETVLARARENGVAIVEANVGVNLIVSKGEIAAYHWGNDQITTAVVEVPVPASTDAARASEVQYMALQGPESARRYEELQKRLRGEKNLMDVAERGEMVTGVDRRSAAPRRG